MGRGRHVLASLPLVQLVLGACSGSESPTAVIDPVYEDPCRFFPADGCSDNGECHGDAAGEPVCLCQPGYHGDACEVCEGGFHLDSHSLCVSDRGCAGQDTDPCGDNGQCFDMSGVLACNCKVGYGGPRCTLCADGFALVDGVCRPDKRGPSTRDGGTTIDETASLWDAGRSDSRTDAGPKMDAGSEPQVCTSEQTTRLSFDGLTGFPTDENQCNAEVALRLPELIARSRIGSSTGYVWLCSKSKRESLGLSSSHIELEASPDQLAQIAFPSKAEAVRFDYGAPESALSLDVLVNDTAVQTIDVPQFGKGSITLEMAQPSTNIALRSRTPFRQNIAIDNLEYKHQQCQ